MSLVEEGCKALVPVGPGEWGNECPRICGKPATDIVGGIPMCIQHVAEMESEAGVWTYSNSCRHCGQEHGTNGKI